MKTIVAIFSSLFLSVVQLHAQNYPQGYFRHPLNIPMELVANFGEIRTNHWHMGLDIRTQQKVNLPVYAAAEGFVSRIVVEPGGFGQAIYIDHPNGFTTLYAHLNTFFPALAEYIKQEQYARESWKVDLRFQAHQFPVAKGMFIALSGNTGGSAGPHVHFEIRDTKTEKVLNPLLFRMPIADAVPPTISRLAMYDRNLSTYMQPPQLLNIQNTNGKLIRVGSDKVSFAVGAVDRFTGSANPNGIYSARVSIDGKPISEFVLDNIDYNESRYINAQIDYSFAARGGAMLQHISPLPGAKEVGYNTFDGDGIIHLDDFAAHNISIEVKDANGNTSKVAFKVQRDTSLPPATEPIVETFLPNHVNVFDRSEFQLFTTEKTMYDAVPVRFSTAPGAAHAVSPQYNFLDASIPAHDSVTVKIKLQNGLSALQKERLVIKNTSGNKTFVQKGRISNGWATAKFRQFGSYQLFLDDQPPLINAVSPNLSKAASIAITPRDNFENIKSFRAELDGKWLMFTNDKGKTWRYKFDEHFPRGVHELKVVVEDEAGNVAERVFSVKR